MANTFTFGEIRRVMRALGMRPREGKFKVEVWSGTGANGEFARTVLHPHPKPLATGTASQIAKSLGFKNAEAMHDFLQRL